MSFIYTITETERENLPNGVYREKITSIEKKVYSYQGNMISYIEVKWDVLLPLEYKGREEIDTFYVGHTDAKRANSANWKFSELCKQMTGLKTGAALDTGEMIGREADVTIENNVSEKNGKIYQNVVNRVLVTSESNDDIPETTYNKEKTAAILALAGIQMPTTPVASGQPLNDEVPF
jgi:hypothetical protein